MPSQQEVKWSQLKVGIIVLISTALLCILLFLMTSASGMSLFSKKLTVTTYFENAAGLQLLVADLQRGVRKGRMRRNREQCAERAGCEPKKFAWNSICKRGHGRRRAGRVAEKHTIRTRIS